jgi:hypothetical protein
VLCAGYADRRKGIDLFVDMALEVLQTLSRVTFIWLGHWDTSIEADIKRRVDESDYSNHFIFPGLDYETDIYFAGSDLYALMSREDPFPSVVMEALDVAVPVIAFQGAGGFSELLEQGCGVLVPHCDTSAFAQQVSRLLTDGRIREELGGTGEDIIRHQFSFRHYLFDLLSLAQIDIARVSVVVPNYNYAHYLKERIQSILNQTYPIYELIILDDYSTDDSIAVIKELISSTNVDCKLSLNEKNSGSVFYQWQKGAKQAEGDFLWIAEADDSAEPNFLETLLQGFADKNVVLSYSESKQIDESGGKISDNYRYYTDDISRTRWLSSYTTEGEDEIREALAVKNTIPNVSGVVFRTPRFLQIINDNLDEILSHQYAGDWVLYINLLSSGRLSEIISIQEKVKSAYSLEPDILEAIDDYRDSLRKQFDLLS